jgi:hypothetical protein
MVGLVASLRPAGATAQDYASFFTDLPQMAFLIWAAVRPFKKLLRIIISAGQASN